MKTMDKDLHQALIKVATKAVPRLELGPAKNPQAFAAMLADQIESMTANQVALIGLVGPDAANATTVAEPDENAKRVQCGMLQVKALLAKAGDVKAEYPFIKAAGQQLEQVEALVKATGARICAIEKESTDKQCAAIEHMFLGTTEFKEWGRVSPKLATIQDFVKECGGLVDKMQLAETENIVSTLLEVSIEYTI